MQSIFRVSIARLAVDRNLYFRKWSRLYKSTRKVFFKAKVGTTSMGECHLFYRNMVVDAPYISTIRVVFNKSRKTYNSIVPPRACWENEEHFLAGPTSCDKCHRYLDFDNTCIQYRYWHNQCIRQVRVRNTVRMEWYRPTVH